MEKLVKQDIHWVDSQSELEKVCHTLQDRELLAVDTEFMRSRTYYPIAGLIQVNDGITNYLIDPVVIEDLSPFNAILANADIIKALHSCSEDLEVFHRLFQSLPTNVFDTQVAAAFTGYGFSVGFANLVKASLDVDLPKSETRSDWLQRPLSIAQINYAALDVEYLFQLAVKLRQALVGNGRLTWVEEECERILAGFHDSQNPELSYLRSKSAWKLTAEQLAVLQALSKWREETAQKRDVPRNRVIKEHTLFTLALKQPSQPNLLRSYDGITERMIKTDGAAIIDIIRSRQALPPGQLPEQMPRPLTSPQNETLRIMRDRVQQVADKLDIPCEILVRKKDYEAVIRSGLDGKADHELPATFEGWRKSVVGDLLLQTINTLASETETIPGSTP